jgi:hypothetical protein
MPQWRAPSVISCVTATRTTSMPLRQGSAGLLDAGGLVQRRYGQTTLICLLPVLHKFLYDIGVVSTPELMPSAQPRHDTGRERRKMSKSRGNVVNPDRSSTPTARHEALYAKFIATSKERAVVRPLPSRAASAFGPHLDLQDHVTRPGVFFRRAGAPFHRTSRRGASTSKTLS